MRTFTGRATIIAALAALAACAPRPAPVAQPVAPPPAEESTLVVPVRASLAPLLPQIEREVPRTFQQDGTTGGIDIRLEAQRLPITLEIQGNEIVARTRILYAVEACRSPLPCLSCGFDEPRRVSDITLRSELTWDPRWFLRSITRPEPPSFPNRCRVSLLNIDVTDFAVAPRVEEQLRQVAKTIDAATPGLTGFAEEARGVWASLQQPWPLEEGTWLVFEPRDLVLGPVSGSGQTLESRLAIRALTRVVKGSAPVLRQQPLPPLRTGDVPDGGLRVPVDLEMSHEEATALLAANMRGASGLPFQIDSLRLVPGSGRRLVVEAEVNHPRYRGPIRLQGTPAWDPATRSIVVADLDYQLTGSRSPLLRIRERLAHDALRDRLRARARWDLGRRLDGVRADLTRSINRDLGNGASLRGTITSVAPELIFSHDRGLTVRVVATGKVVVDVGTP